MNTFLHSLCTIPEPVTLTNLYGGDLGCGYYMYCLESLDDWGRGVELECDGSNYVYKFDVFARLQGLSPEYPR